MMVVFGSPTTCHSQTVHSDQHSQTAPLGCIFQLQRLQREDEMCRGKSKQHSGSPLQAHKSSSDSLGNTSRTGTLTRSHQHRAVIKDKALRNHFT